MRTFLPWMSPEVIMLSRSPVQFATFWALDRPSSLNIKEVTAVQNFDIFLDIMTPSMTSSVQLSTGIITWPGYIYTHSLVILSSSVLELLRKMWQFQLNMIIEGRLCRHAVKSLVTSSLWNSFSWMIYILSFYTWCQIEAMLKIAIFSKLTKFWGPGELFRHKCHWK